MCTSSGFDKIVPIHIIQCSFADKVFWLDNAKVVTKEAMDEIKPY